MICVRLAIPEPLVILDKAERTAVRTEKNIAGKLSAHRMNAGSRQPILR